MPSFRKHLRKAASATTQRSASPCRARPWWRRRCRPRRCRRRPPAGRGRSPRAPTLAAARLGEGRRRTLRGDDTMAARTGESQRRRSRRAHARSLRRPPHLRPVRRHQPAVLRRALPAGAPDHARADPRRAQRRLHGRRLRARERPARRVRGAERRRRHLPAAGPGRGQRIEFAGARASPPTCRCCRADAIRSPSSIRRRCTGRSPSGTPCATAPTRCRRRSAPRSAHDHRPARRGAHRPALRRAEAARRRRPRSGRRTGTSAIPAWRSGADPAAVERPRPTRSCRRAARCSSAAAA